MQGGSAENSLPSPCLWLFCLAKQKVVLMDVALCTAPPEAGEPRALIKHQVFSTRAFRWRFAHSYKAFHLLQLCLRMWAPSWAAATRGHLKDTRSMGGRRSPICVTHYAKHAASSLTTVHLCSCLWMLWVRGLQQTWHEPFPWQVWICCYEGTVAEMEQCC